MPWLLIVFVMTSSFGGVALADEPGPVGLSVGLDGSLGRTGYGGEDALAGPGFYRSDNGYELGAVAQLDVFATARFLFGLRSGLMYTARNIHVETDFEFIGKTEMRYVEVPLLVRAGLGPFGLFEPYVIAGPRLAFRQASRVLNANGTVVDQSSIIQFYDIGLSAGGGLSVEVAPRISVFIEGRYDLGLVEVERGDDMDDFTNTGFFLTLGASYRVLDGPPRPARDSDGDGIADDLDKCTDQREDRDGFQDDDGCPDPDNDGDGLADSRDECINDAEDIDGFQDRDGCPDPDNDGDGVADVQDRCPDQATTSVKWPDGCPRSYDDALEITDSAIVLKRPLLFEIGQDRLLEEHHFILDEVAAALSEHRDLRVIVRGHADDRTGNARQNRELSRNRASAVRTYLIEHGVEAERLQAKGLGDEQDIFADPGLSRRVTFHIVQPDGSAR